MADPVSMAGLPADPEELNDAMFADEPGHGDTGDDSAGAGKGRGKGRGGGTGADGRPKRQQVARACQRCASSKRKCSGTFPCERCVRLNIADTCVEVVLKRQKAGDEGHGGGRARGAQAARRAGGQGDRTILGAAIIDSYAWPGQEPVAPSGPGKRRGDRLSRDVFLRSQRGTWAGLYGGEDMDSGSDGGSGAESETSHSAMARQLAHARIYDDSAPVPGGAAARHTKVRGTKTARMAANRESEFVAAIDDGTVVRLSAPAHARNDSSELDDAMKANVDLILRASGEAATAEEKAALEARTASLRAEAAPTNIHDAYGGVAATLLSARTVVRPAPMSAPEWLGPLLARGYSVDFNVPPAMAGMHAEVDIFDPTLATVPVWQALYEDGAYSLSFDQHTAPIPRHAYANSMGELLFNVAGEDVCYRRLDKELWLFIPDVGPRATLLSQLRLAAANFFTWRGLYMRTNVRINEETGRAETYYLVFEAQEHVFVSYYPKSYSIKATLSAFSYVGPPLTELSVTDLPVLRAYAMQLDAQTLDAAPRMPAGTGGASAAPAYPVAGGAAITRATLSTHHDSFTEPQAAAAPAFTQEDPRFSMEQYLTSPPADVLAAAAHRNRMRTGSHDQSLHAIATTLNGRFKNSFSLPEGDAAAAAAASGSPANVMSGVTPPGGSWNHTWRPDAAAAGAANAADPANATAAHLAAMTIAGNPAYSLVRSPSEQEFLASYRATGATGGATRPAGLATVASPLGGLAPPSSGEGGFPAHGLVAAAAYPSSAGALPAHHGSFGYVRLSGDFSGVGMQLDPSSRRTSDLPGAFGGVAMYGRSSLSEAEAALGSHAGAPLPPGAPMLSAAFGGHSAEFDAEAQVDRTASTSSLGMPLPVTTLARGQPSLPGSRAAADQRALSTMSIDMAS